MGEAVEDPLLETRHRFLAADARALPMVADGSVQLVLTSPPYPMVAMWDGVFSDLSPAAAAALAADDGPGAFEAMHAELDRVWAECARVLSPGGLLCINIGDATRTVGKAFQLYSNHARIVAAAQALGLSPLPDILWRKPTNAPNKFMGSGMLPGGAYVTYEHEYVLIFRKGNRRVFRGAAKERRSRSAYFWEERNVWFSDLWTDLRGTRQRLNAAARKRSAAYPLELALRLVQMYSCQGDTVLDPFSGTGTTAQAALMTARDSVSVDILEELRGSWAAGLEEGLAKAEAAARARLDRHRRFVDHRIASGKALKHSSLVYGIPVMTRQEVKLELLAPRSLHWEHGEARAACAPVRWPKTSINTNTQQ